MQEVTLIGRATSMHNVLVKILNGGQSIVLLVIRLYFGWVCAHAGYAHLTHFKDTVETFADWHVPMPKVSVAISGTTEFVGGVMLMAGLFSRLISIPLMFNFLVAIIVPSLADPKFHDMILHFWKNPDVVLKDEAFLFFGTAVIVLFFGPGIISIDAILKKTMGPRRVLVEPVTGTVVHR